MTLRVLAMIGWVTFGIIAGPLPATIVNSGSTNRAGFRITVDASGVAEFVSMPRRRAAAATEEAKPIRVTVPRDVTDRFYGDLKAVGPLASLPEMHCAKSVSFGSTLAVAVGGEQTPDLSCGDGGNTALRDLIRDVNEIVALCQKASSILFN
jgi:hypothetical protein